VLSTFSITRLTMKVLKRLAVPTPAWALERCHHGDVVADLPGPCPICRILSDHSQVIGMHARRREACQFTQITLFCRASRRMTWCLLVG